MGFDQLRCYPRGHSQKNFRLRRACYVSSNLLGQDNSFDLTFRLLFLGHHDWVRRILAASAALSRSLSTTTTASIDMESIILETNMGEIELELYWNHAPKVCPTHLTTNMSRSTLQGTRLAKTLLNWQDGGTTTTWSFTGSSPYVTRMHAEGASDSRRRLGFYGTVGRSYWHWKGWN